MGVGYSGPWIYSSSHIVTCYTLYAILRSFYYDGSNGSSCVYCTQLEQTLRYVNRFVKLAFNIVSSDNTPRPPTSINVHQYDALCSALDRISYSSNMEKGMYRYHIEQADAHYDDGVAP